jgi:steroid delta-isomerase-like uncharacterized protein
MDHAATMQELYDRINAGDIEGFGALLADDFVEHEELPGLEQTKDGVKALFHMYRTAFPDLNMHVEDLIVSGDKAVARVRTTGTHQGDFLGLAATGSRVDVPLVDIMRLGDDGLVREHWGVFDSMRLMQQLGAIPEGPPA